MFKDGDLCKMTSAKSGKVAEGVIIDLTMKLTGIKVANESDITNVLGKDIAKIEQVYDKVDFTIYYTRSKLKASQLLAIKRSGKCTPKMVENTNRLASLIARKVIEGQAIILSSMSFTQDDLPIIISMIMKNAGHNANLFRDVLSDPRMRGAIESLSEMKDAYKQSKSDIPDDVKKVINQVRSATKP